MRHLQVSLLGAFAVELDHEPVVDFGYDKVRALMAYLAIEGCRQQRRDTLADLLWPERNQSDARNNLRTALFFLRRALEDRDSPAPFLLVSRESLQLNPDADIEVDVERFLRLTNDSRRHSHPPGQECEACVAAMTEAVGLYRGELLPGFAVQSAAFEVWLVQQRQVLHQEVLHVLDKLVQREEARGEYELALVHARHQIQLEPWHEAAHRRAMRALALSGRRNAAVAQFELCCEVLREELGVEPEAATISLYQQLRDGSLPVRHERGISPITYDPGQVGVCPYLGLAAFGEDDADLFFGRDAVVDRLEQAVLQNDGVTILVGPSGSGKSSVLHGGLVPRLRARGRWTIRSLRPGGRPLLALARAMVTGSRSGDADLDDAGVMATVKALRERSDALSALAARLAKPPSGDARLLLVVDQLEELFTLTSDVDEQERYIDALVRCAAIEPIAVVLAMRADFMGQALSHRALADALQTGALMLGPMTREELREAIEKPAAARGAIFETGLSARILRDVGREPGRLPLLEFALMLLWQHLDRGWLTHAAYEAIGQVEGALAGYAQQVYETLSETDQVACRRVFTQLVQPGEGTEDTRRVAVPADVGPEAWPLVRHLADRRLIVSDHDAVTGAETVEVAHEALIRHWAQLREWMAEDRAFRTWQERLRVALRSWEITRRDEGALLRGLPLAEAKEWQRLRDRDLTEVEREFIEAGLALRERRAAEEAAQREAERQAARHLAEARDAAVREREEALRQAAIGLAAEARNQMQGPGQDVAVLLALEAVEAYPYTSEAERTLAEIVLAWRLTGQFHHEAALYDPAQLSPDGDRLLTADNDGVFRIWVRARGELLLQVKAYPGIEGAHLHARWSPCGTRVLTGAVSPSPRIWDAETGALLLELSYLGGWAVAWSPDGSRVLTSGSWPTGGAAVWNASTGQVCCRIPGPEQAPLLALWSPDGDRVVTSLGHIWHVDKADVTCRLESFRPGTDGEDPLVPRWSPDGGLLAGCSEGRTQVWDASTGRELLGWPTGYRMGADVFWSPDGERLLLVGVPGGGDPATLWDATSGHRLRDLPYYDQALGPASPWSPDGRRVLLADPLGRVTVWDAQSGRELLALQAHVGSATASWLPDGTGIVSSALDGNVRTWHLSSALLEVDGQKECPGYIFDGFSIPIWSPDSTRVGRGFANGKVGVWDVATQTPVLRFRKQSEREVRMNYLAWSPDGSRIATGTIGGEADVWSATTGDNLLAFPPQSELFLGVHWSPDGNRLLACVRARRAVIWDTESGVELIDFRDQNFFLGAWSPDGTRVALVDQFSLGGPVRVWDTCTGEAVLTLLPDDFPHGTSGVAWSPDGARIVTFSTDGLGRLWDAGAGELLASFPTPGNCMVAEWSPSGSRIQVGHLSGVHVWDAASLEKVAVYPAGDKLWASWSPDGTMMALAYANQDLKVCPAWKSLEELIAYAKEHCVLRALTSEERAQYGLRAQ